MPGLWAPVLILFSRDLLRYFEHQVLAALGKSRVRIKMILVW